MSAESASGRDEPCRRPLLAGKTDHAWHAPALLGSACAARYSTGTRASSSRRATAEPVFQRPAGAQLDPAPVGVAHVVEEGVAVGRVASPASGRRSGPSPAGSCTWIRSARLNRFWSMSDELARAGMNRPAAKRACTASAEPLADQPADLERAVGPGGDRLEVGAQALEDPVIPRILRCRRWARPSRRGAGARPRGRGWR